jgi:hypothetical protein
VLESVELGRASCDAVANASGVTAGEAAIGLARLELLGYLRVDADGRYSRTDLLVPEDDRRPATTLDA